MIDIHTLNKKLLPELKDIAKDLGVPRYQKLKKQELDKIKWQAFEEGKATAAEEYAEKLEEYEKNLEIINNDETKLAQTLNAIKNKIESIDQQMVVIFNKWSDQCLMLSYGIACKVIEKTKETIPVEIIASYLHKRLPSLRNELQIQILLNPLDLSKVQERIKKQKINSSNNCLLKFLEDDTVQSGDCTIQIEGGEFVKNSDKMLKEIEESLQNYLSHSNIKTNKENFTSNDNG